MLAMVMTAVLVLYFLATLLVLSFLISRRRALSVLSVAVAACGFVGHTAALIGEAAASGALPVVSLDQALAFVSWALVLFFLVVELRYRLHVLGSFILPLSFLLALPAGVLRSGHGEAQPVLLSSAWLGIHIVFSLLGFVAFAVAFIIGLMYLLQHRLLKEKRFNMLYEQLPSLDLLDEMNQGTILLGFPLLTIGILAGAIWGAGQGHGGIWSWSPKQMLTVVTWLFYLVILHGRMNFGWRAKRAASLAIIGFVVVGVTFLYAFL
ncbi:MAG TPA: cytochrome c biogenesis protein CcsA [Nitrospiria bacterium]|nr:cytochrome c biogenesis protein CcsA [Nitrospiria bacterium]